MSFLQPQHSADTLLIVPPRGHKRQNISSSDSELAAPGEPSRSPTSQFSPSSPRKNRLMLLQEKFRSLSHRENSLDVPKLSRSPHSTSEASDGDTSDGPSDEPTPSPRPEASSSKGFRFDLRRLRTKQKTISPSQCYGELSAWLPVVGLNFYSRFCAIFVVISP